MNLAMGTWNVYRFRLSATGLAVRVSTITYVVTLIYDAIVCLRAHFRSTTM